MATILRDKPDVGDVNSRRYWGVFTESEHRQMLRDDFQAGATIALILTGVIIVGLLIGLTGVLVSLR